MPQFKDTRDELRVLFEKIAEAQTNITQLVQQPLPKHRKDAMQAEFERQIEFHENNVAQALQELVKYPPHHLRHVPRLPEFHAVAPYDRSVFIMTKFPEGKAAADVELQRVIDAVRKAVTDAGYTPRIALDKRYHPGLWDNVEAYLFGCERGIAIVESKYRPELNPNVTMEWGWMRGMGKDVLYLVERTFDRARADISGLLQDEFTWDTPEPEIETAVAKWLA